MKPVCVILSEQEGRERKKWVCVIYNTIVTNVQAKRPPDKAQLYIPQFSSIPPQHTLSRKYILTFTLTLPPSYFHAYFYYRRCLSLIIYLLFKPFLKGILYILYSNYTIKLFIIRYIIILYRYIVNKCYIFNKNCR